MEALLSLCLLALGIVAWHQGSRVKELANKYAAEFCREQNLQWLDGSAYLKSIKLIRLDGRLRVRRLYYFDCYDGEDRMSAEVVFIGHDIQSSDYVAAKTKGSSDKVIHFKSRKKRDK